jgi:segregation and condensation protein B
MSHEFNIQDEDLKALAQLEALLFAAPGPCGLEQLARTLQISKNDVLRLTDLLAEHYQALHGIRVQRIKDKLQLITAPEHAELIEQLLGLEVSTRLSQPALEVLAIIAYKRMTTRPEIENIRGVNSDSVVKSLLAKGLIEELGRSDAPGRPILYGVTPEFLQYFGLESLDQLPPIDLETLTDSGSVEKEKELRVLKN